jgi:hypothetical protein
MRATSSRPSACRLWNGSTYSASGKETPVEDMLITMGINILLTAVKNPTFQAQFKTQLLKVAADIQIAFGLTPPTS